jgi:hypothetical protein
VTIGPLSAQANRVETPPTTTFADFAQRADYSLLESLLADPQASEDGQDHRPREVVSGHYVPVTPTALPEPHYVAHSPTLFNELGLSAELAEVDEFRRFFPATSAWPRRRCGRLAGPPAMPFRSTAPNTAGSAHLEPAMAMAMAGPFRCLRAFSRASAGRCSSRAVVPPLTAAAPMAAPCCAPACASFWPRSSCTPWGCPPPGR